MNYSKTELQGMIDKMQAASDAFYPAAAQTGHHAFIEFTGLMNEYIKICHRAHEQGIDFPSCSAHSGQALPMETYEAEYLGEKLGCIYGPSVSDPKLATIMLGEMGLK